MPIDALFLSPDLQSRTRFKQTAAMTRLFGNVTLAATLSEGAERLQAGQNVDVLFTSAKFDKPVLHSFIDRAKGSREGQDSAYLVVLSDNQSKQQDLAGLMIEGSDGFLMEPYSVTNLVDTTQIAYRIRKERLKERDAAAVELLVTSALEEVDRAYMLAKHGKDPHLAMRKLRELGGTLQRIPKDLQPYYYERAIERFGEARPNTVTIEERIGYSGSSVRVRQRLVKKHLGR